MSKWIIFAGLMLIMPLLFAGCAADAYSKACASCTFDSQGKIDQACSGGYKASGTACVSTSYPIMATKYAKGECSAVDDCTSELSSCVAQYSSGNDSADCKEGSVAICYAATDQCTKQAAVKCGEIGQQCPGSTAAFLLLFAGLAFVKLTDRY